MTEKFEFNSEVYLDGERQIPHQINVAHNAQGVLEEHMGNADVKGDDLYRLPVNDTAVMLTVDALCVIKLYSKDLKDNRHLATLTAVNSHIDGLRMRENNTVINCRLSQSYMRDSLISYTGEQGVADGLHLESASVKNCVFTNIKGRVEGALVYVRNSTVDGGFMRATQAVTVQRATLNNCHLAAEDNPIRLHQVVMTNVDIYSLGLLSVANGRWTDLVLAPMSLDVQGQFHMSQLQTPDAVYNFYRAEDNIYYVQYPDGGVNILVDPNGGPGYEEAIREMVCNGLTETAYEKSIARYVLDAVSSRLKVINVLEDDGVFKEWGVEDGKEEVG